MNRTEDDHVHDDHGHHGVLIFTDHCVLRTCFKSQCNNCLRKLNDPQCIVSQVSLYHCCFNFHDYCWHFSVMQISEKTKMSFKAGKIICLCTHMENWSWRAGANFVMLQMNMLRSGQILVIVWDNTSANEGIRTLKILSQSEANWKNV